MALPVGWCNDNDPHHDAALNAEGFTDPTLATITTFTDTFVSMSKAVEMEAHHVQLLQHRSGQLE